MFRDEANDESRVNITHDIIDTPDASKYYRRRRRRRFISGCLRPDIAHISAI